MFQAQRKDLEVRLGLSQILERPMTANQVIKQEKQADQRPPTSIVVNNKGDSPTVQAQPSTPQKRPSTQSSSSSEKSKIVSKSVSSSKVLSPSKVYFSSLQLYLISIEATTYPTKECIS